jgi:hypothetical protein
VAGELGVGAGNPLAEAVSALYERCPDVLRKAWASERRVVRHLYINAMPYCELHNDDHFLHLNLNWSPFSHQLTLIAEVSAVLGDYCAVHAIYSVSAPAGACAD